MNFESYLDYIDEAILVIDNSYDVVSFNEAFRKLFPSVRKAVFAPSCIVGCDELRAMILESMDCESTQSRDITYGKSRFAVNISDIYDERAGETAAKAFILTDVTDYGELTAAAEESNIILQKSNEAIQSQKNDLVNQSILKEKVAAGAESEAVLRELHDTLGHSLTVLNALNRLALLELEKDSEAGRRALSETFRLARISLAELDASDVLTGGGSGNVSITAFLYRLKQSAANVSLKVNLEITGKEDLCHRRLFYPVTRVVQEASTNCLRHADATEFRVKIDFGTEHIKLFMEDNGTSLLGKDVPPKGNGLTGMEKRVNDYSGSLSLGVSESGGLSLSVALPVPI